ncbi:related to DNA replication complex GINS protein PSF3 [Saccharomycodes ludwigii]|uniref:DNA replication complex GINS protein PSF3 n=1 Tax=Saccharomycodes ludwigii TaxID=36035 RepID=A0A376B239_9ASCO|nr:hypothetical protein SCDLUD_004982 [Saccharomycodes ludwigii]KAH3898660.1 hypothetical protein SCDLUD_004982 [Saccharomycodes ludwigii]SSD58756.1 related to DNA replication complex GINS protein PSF3 [Saccharomycodes ludwigii]
MSYYDLDDILTESIKFPCKFNSSIAGLGFLEGNPGKPIAKNSKIELPFWLSKILAEETGTDGIDTTGIPQNSIEEFKDFYIELLQPPFFQPRVLNAIKAGGETLDLHTICPYFYFILEKWSTIYNSDELVDLFMELLRKRGVKISNYASSTSMLQASDQQPSKNYIHNNSQEFLLTLDEFEKKLYKTTQLSYKNMNKWLHNR